MIVRDWYRLGALPADRRRALRRAVDTRLPGVFDGPAGDWGRRRLPVRLSAARPAAVAGTFYPADPSELAKLDGAARRRDTARRRHGGRRLRGAARRLPLVRAAPPRMCTAQLRGGPGRRRIGGASGPRTGSRCGRRGAGRESTGSTPLGTVGIDVDGAGRSSRAGWRSPTTRTRSASLTGVVAGIGGYGDCLGLPNIGGGVVFDPSLQGDPLVNALCVGVLPVDRLQEARRHPPRNADRAARAKTGRDGIGGVSVLASATFDEGPRKEEATERSRSAYPFIEKLLIERASSCTTQEADRRHPGPRRRRPDLRR